MDGCWLHTHHGNRCGHCGSGSLLKSWHSRLVVRWSALMCGICGIVHCDPGYRISKPTLLAMRDTLIHRGPDDAGHYLAPGIALGSRRLAILDLSERGHMPMSTADGRYWITYNGEVYNYQELRLGLENRG